MKYRVCAVRSTVYEVNADDGQHAIDEMVEGNAEEVDGETERITASPLCPECAAELTNRTTRVVEEGLVEATYCDVCSREW